MEEAFIEAEKAMKIHEMPIGCVIVDSSGDIIGRGFNKTNINGNGISHAEFEAIESAGKDADFTTCTLFVTVEPCIMCAAALKIIGMKHIVYGCTNNRFGGVVSCVDSLNISTFQIQDNDQKNRAIDMMRVFYANGR